MCRFKRCRSRLYLPSTTASANISKFRRDGTETHLQPIGWDWTLAKKTHIVENRFLTVHANRTVIQ